MEISEEQIVVMAVSAIAEELKEDIFGLRVVSFKEVYKSSLEQYISEHKISYKKYQLGE